MRILPFGPRGLLLEVDDLDAVLALDAALQRDRPAGVTDIVPAARTVLVRLDSAADLPEVRRQVSALKLAAAPRRPAGETIDIAVTYDGADLDEVAASVGLSRSDLVAAHTATTWTAAFCGFAPGFAYLTGDDVRLATVPRRSSPRTRVPVGSVALAGGFSAVYPSASPGGWQLLGHTDVRVFDADRDPPALLQPGSTVRFVARDASR